MFGGGGADCAFYSSIYMQSAKNEPKLLDRPKASLFPPPTHDAKMFFIQMLLHFSEIVPRVCIFSALHYYYYYYYYILLLLLLLP